MTGLCLVQLRRRAAVGRAVAAAAADRDPDRAGRRPASRRTAGGAADRGRLPGRRGAAGAARPAPRAPARRRCCSRVFYGAAMARRLRAGRALPEGDVAGRGGVARLAAVLLLVGGGRHATLALVLAVQGLCTLGWAWRTGRRHRTADDDEASRAAWRVGAAQLVFAAWVGAATAGLAAVEWYSLPAAAGLLLAAGPRLRHGASWPAWGPGLLVAAVPSTVLAVTTSDGARAVGVLIVAAARAGRGARTGIRAPLMVGAGTVARAGARLHACGRCPGRSDGAGRRRRAARGRACRRERRPVAASARARRPALTVRRLGRYLAVVARARDMPDVSGQTARTREGRTPEAFPARHRRGRRARPGSGRRAARRSGRRATCAADPGRVDVRRDDVPGRATDDDCPRPDGRAEVGRSHRPRAPVQPAGGSAGPRACEAWGAEGSFVRRGSRGRAAARGRRR